ncbi:PP2C family serine/threonine-protein phosphatase [Mycoplasmatota bacterium zrk1]
MLIYEISQTGTSHIKGNIVNQDAKKIVTKKNGLAIAAIADGVGSSKHSDIASKLAVETVVKLCDERVNDLREVEEVKKVVFEAYQSAYKRLLKEAKDNNNFDHDYDTTLDLVIYDGKKIVYGHSGDGGIVGLTNEGDYVKITEPQKGFDGFSVIPLRGGERTWIVDTCTRDFASILMATDGVYDIFFPYLLKGGKNEVYVPLISYFIDNNILEAKKSTIKNIEKSRKNFLESESCKSITDDKTLIVLVNDRVKPLLKDDSFYEEPDWNRLQEEWNKKAYHASSGESQPQNEGIENYKTS